MSDDDDQNLHLVQAFAQAELALFVSPPNPAVGCVVVSPIGKIIGQGHTQATGASHAEVMALRDVLANAESTVGATAYVTLEPCSHFGRTPPCCHALIDAKVAKVVTALLDPNPLVAGKGVAMLRAAASNEKSAATLVLPRTRARLPPCLRDMRCAIFRSTFGRVAR